MLSSAKLPLRKLTHLGNVLEGFYSPLFKLHSICFSSHHKCSILHDAGIGWTSCTRRISVILPGMTHHSFGFITHPTRVDDHLRLPDGYTRLEQVLMLITAKHRSDYSPPLTD